MTVNIIREKLMTYLADADEKKLKALYTLLEPEIAESRSFTLSEEQLRVLDEEHYLHVSGKTKSYSWAEAKDIIRGKKSL